MSFRPEILRGGAPWISRRFARAAACMVALPNFIWGLSPGSELFDNACPSLRDLGGELIGPPAPAKFNVGKDQPIRAATYNIARGKLGMEGINKALKTVKPDVVVLNETTGQSIASIVSEFELDADKQVATAFTMETSSGGYGNAVIAFGDFAISSSASLDLSGDEGMERRSMVLARVVQESTDYNFNIVGLHLANDGKGLFGRTDNEQARLRQAADVRSLVQSLDKPVVVAGDANASKNSPEFALLSAGLTDPYKELGLSGVPYVTFPAIAWNRQIDHILTDGTSAVGMGIAGGGASDHCMVYVDFVPGQTLLE